MSKLIHKMKQKILYLLLSFCLLSSCKDDLMYTPSDPREGNSDVTFCMSFHPETNVSLGGTRAANGDVIKEINNLFIILYDQDGNYTGLHYYFENPNTTYVDRGENCPVDTMPTTEEKTVQAKVECRIPYGTYHIYAVANMGNLAESGYYCGSITKEADFKAIRFKWNTDTIQQNCQMSGYFTTNNTEYVRDKDGNYQRNAENLVIDKDVTSLHAWLRRAVSKVTVAYDATNLREGIYIYLKSVKLKNIPASCSLVDDNIPEGKKINVQGKEMQDLIENGDAIVYETSEKTVSDPEYILTKGHPYIKEHEKIHNNDALSMFFYENMQGIGKEEDITDKRQNAGKGNTIAYPEGAEDIKGEGWRDGKVNGTYVEVEAYYVSNAVGNVGHGRIIYRFMLGKDVITDYNAERNYHYKLTMKFNGNANDVDWHIDYKEDDTPGMYVPDYYVSYLYNQPYIDYESDNSPNKTSYWEKCYPLRLTGSNIGEEVEIRIIENNWYPAGEGKDLESIDFYNNSSEFQNASEEKRASMMRSAVHTYKGDEPTWASRKPTLASPIHYSGIWHGFLSLYPQEEEAQIPEKDIDGKSFTWGRLSAGEYIYWYSRGENPYNFKDKLHYEEPVERTEETKYGEGFRTYKTTLDNNAEVGEKIYPYEYSYNGKSYNSYYKVVKSKKKGGMHETMLYFPLYTRPLIINQKKGFTGNNPYFSFQRTATIQIKTQINDKTIEKTATVRQVRRIINPKGIFRSHDNTTSFKVTLMDRTSEQAGKDFEAFLSDGPWRATIVAGDGWTISGGEGSTNSPISFTVAPKGKIKVTETACALVRVEYHNYHCVHYIHLRQGYAPLSLDGGKPYWHSFNVEYTDGANAYECDTELEGGSMFRYGNLTQPIDGINNDFSYFGYTTTPFNGKFALAPIGESERTDQLKTWDEIKPNSSFTKTTFTVDGVPSRMAKYDDFAALKANKKLDFSLGLCYGDEATENASDDEKAFYYSWFARKGAPKWLTDKATNKITKAGTDSEGISGVRGCFVYNHENAKVIFLSLGACSHGRRKGKKQSGTVEDGLLRYGDFDLSFGEEIEDQGPYVPQLHALYSNYGAIYWLGDRKPTETPQTDNNTAVAWDINYGGIDFNSIYVVNLHTYGLKSSGEDADAAYIRLVQDTEPKEAQCKKIDERMKAYQKKNVTE